MNVCSFVLSAITFDSVLTGNAMYTYYNKIPKLMNTLGMAALTLNKDFTHGVTLNPRFTLNYFEKYLSNMTHYMQL
jgi:hypothetical protein